ncbi:hypothetical protein VTK73DRAFT_924 [Phialemonium thermophilum]|uniref:Cytochrome P450 n=1 Tax=Phialemonium thermophilum TaxID=223376 RepID=A0ABR3XCK0_9PEZI
MQISSVVLVSLLDRMLKQWGIRSSTGLPFIGRVHDVPAQASWLKFYEWSKVYGPIYQMEIFGETHVWISSERIAHDLLSKRSAIYSDRPVIPNLPDNRTSGEYLALLGRTETWRRQRKLCHQLMSRSTADGLHAYPARERDRLLYLLWRDPDRHREWIEQFTSRTISRLSWGSAHPARLLRQTTFGLLETISPAGALPNVVNWLVYLPETVSPWKRKERRRHGLERQLFQTNVEFVRRMRGQDKAPPSFIRTFLERKDERPTQDATSPTRCPSSSSATSMSSVSSYATAASSPSPAERTAVDAADGCETSEATSVVGLMAIAGALTIGSPIQSFLLAMCHYPQWLQRLQREIDTELGGRCPEWEDREKLPLLRAVVKEVLRWRPPVPTGIPHAAEKDDVYNGYFIPARATIHALEWGITRDESVYPDPETFNPERWLSPLYPTYREPLTRHPNLDGYSQFGFGRRTCQGVPVVEQDLLLSVGGMAWAFDVRRRRDAATAAEIPVHWNDYSPLLIAKPAPFQFDLVLRGGEERGALLLERYRAAVRDEQEDTEGDGAGTISAGGNETEGAEVSLDEGGLEKTRRPKPARGDEGPNPRLEKGGENEHGFFDHLDRVLVKTTLRNV